MGKAAQSAALAAPSGALNRAFDALQRPLGAPRSIMLRALSRLVLCKSLPLLPSFPSRRRIGRRQPFPTRRLAEAIKGRWLSETYNMFRKAAARTIPTPEELQQIGLTVREGQVLHWVIQGKRDWETGRILAASPRTIQNHVRSILFQQVIEVVFKSERDGFKIQIFVGLGDGWQFDQRIDCAWYPLHSWQIGLEHEQALIASREPEAARVEWRYFACSNSISTK